MLHRPIVTAAIAAILAMEVPAQPVAAMMATTPSQLRGATTADNLELVAWHHQHHWHRHYWHWYFPRFWLRPPWGWPWHHHRHHHHHAPPATEKAPSKPAEPDTAAPSQSSPQAPNQ
jgi:hypothetical protein